MRPYPLVMPNIRQQGFSLIELAIVLVVIGLLVGGVLVGQDMIRSARLNSVVSNVDKYQKAVDIFRTKYDAFPGDISDASSIWGTTCATPATNCNGNGNTQLTTAEAFRFWQHLNLASLLEGSYTGLAAASGDAVTPRDNTPQGPIDGGVFGAYTTAAGILGVQFGALDTATTTDQLGSEAILNPIEAHRLDRKFDDGIYNTGNILSQNGTGLTGCINAGDYDKDREQVSCVMQFVLFNLN